MTGPWIDDAVLTVDSPFARPLSFFAVEAVFGACAVLTFLHARRDRRTLFAWLTVVVYGLVMEILSYEVFHTFAHGRFTVSFYRGQLPLYIVGVYPLLVYTAIVTARRYGLRPAAEPFVVGLLAVCMDAPYDIVGARLGWWTWSETDPNAAYRWQGVPVTSYYFYLAFGGAAAWLTRVFGGRRLVLAPAVALLVILVGFLGFVPFHLLKACHVSDGTIVGGGLVVCAIAGVVSPKTPLRNSDRLLFAIPIVVYVFELAIALGAWVEVAAIVPIVAFGLGATALAHRAGSRS